MTRAILFAWFACAYKGTRLLIGLIPGFRWVCPEEIRWMYDNAFGFLDPNPRMVDAWERVKAHPWSLHHLTNLLVEWCRLEDCEQRVAKALSGAAAFMFVAGLAAGLLLAL